MKKESKQGKKKEKVCHLHIKKKTYSLLGYSSNNGVFLVKPPKSEFRESRDLVLYLAFVRVPDVQWTLG